MPGAIPRRRSRPPMSARRGTGWPSAATERRPDQASDVNQIDDQKCRDHGDETKGENIAHIVTGDAGARPQSGSRLARALICPDTRSQPSVFRSDRNRKTATGTKKTARRNSVTPPSNLADYRGLIERQAFA